MQVHPSQGSSGADDLFATETMAELCARQGRFGDAVAIYRRLLGGEIDADKGARWQARLDELERAPLVAAASLHAQAAAGVTPPSVSKGLSLAGRAVSAVAGRLGPAAVSASPSDGARERAQPPSIAVTPSSGDGLRLPMLVTQPVRGGQVIYAVKTDLIVVASVNPGAQLIADGNIHVYGPLRGRAVAGATGCREARIFCRHLEAELVGVDTGYLSREHLPPHRIGKPAQIMFVSDASGERCVIADLA